MSSTLKVRKLTMDAMLSAALREITGPLKQLLLNLSGEDGDTWLGEFKKFLRKEPCWTSVKRFLRLISADHDLIIDSAGSEILAYASDVFDYIDPAFIRVQMTAESIPHTDPTPVSVYEQTQDATFVQLFGSLNKDLDKLCLTQAQIKGFVVKYRSWLRVEGFGTFFLLKSYGQFCVADVRFRSDGGLKVRINRLESLDVWRPEYRHRLVVPKLD